MGHELTKIRCDLVKRWCHNPSEVIDIGIGGGAFVESLGCSGFDVSKDANEWLSDRSAFVDPYKQTNHALSFWDSLEHIPEFYKLLETIENDGYIFMSIPIFYNKDHVLVSKHYKPGEHIWYFTEEGLINMMKSFEFICLEKNDDETKAGREGIMSFAFIKTKQ